MRGARNLKWAGLTIALLGLVVPAQAYEVPEVPVTDGDRLVTNFQREAAIVPQGQLRLELHGFTGIDEKTHDGPQVIYRGFPPGDADRGELRADLRDLSGGVVGFRGSYGLVENSELGFNVTGVLQRLHFSDGTTEYEQDMGDLSLYGKYKYSICERTALAGGLELSLPTGQEKKRLGTGNVGMNPFVSTRYTAGRWAVGGHVGYQLNAEAPIHASHSQSVDNVFNWSVNALARADKTYGLHAEITGRHFRYGGAHVDDVSVVPGVDYRYSNSVTIRPFGIAGITEEAIDWGLGLGVSMTF